MASRHEEIRRRIFEITEIGYTGDFLSRFYDLFSSFVLIVNLTVSVLLTFEDITAKYGPLLLTLELLTVIFFAVDYVLRFISAKYEYPNLTEPQAMLRYSLSFTGIVDLLSFLPYFLPIVFPTGAAAFRMFRVMRIFRMFRINTYYDSLNIITEVISSKRPQLMSSVFIILILMLGSSLSMYSLEHTAQPEVFKNAFSGIWWAASTLLTVGYGDIYPITTAGKILGIFITFLGVGMVAIPTGIISAGFVELNTRLQRRAEQARELDVNFIKVPLQAKDEWVGRTISSLELPRGVLVAAIQRKHEVIIPRGQVKLQENDMLVLGAEPYEDDWQIDLKEITLRRQHPWNGQYIRDLDISRQTLIVLIKREGKALIPRGDIILKEGDVMLLYTKMRLADAGHIYV